MQPTTNHYYLIEIGFIAKEEESSSKQEASNMEIASLLLVLLLLQKIPEFDAKVSSLIVFGDSTVDSGNNNYIPTVLRSNFKPYGRDFEGGKSTGRFSNGRVPTDFIAEAFGLKKTIPAYLDPAYSIKDFVTGVCFASAGTGYDNLTSSVLVSTQKLLAGVASSFVTQIYQLGARKISITGLPPMGCLPLERTTNLASGGGCIEKYNSVSLDFNKKLQVLIETLNKEVSGLQLVLTDPYAILYDMVQNPHSFGFENAAVACCGTGRVEMSYLCNDHNPYTCADANKYVFWDSFHPTEKTNAIIAEYAVRTSLAVFH